MDRELSLSEAIKLGLPSRCPLTPFESVVWAEPSPIMDVRDSLDFEDELEAAA